ncbi:MAG: PilZ domain-containing protein [Anaerolineales bacterium]
MKVHSIDNISSEGLLISFRGDLNPGELVELSFCLPGDKRRLQLAGSITYIIRNDFQELCSAGLRLIDPKETHQARIRNFLVAATSTTAIKSLCDRFHKRKSDGEHSIGNRENIVQLFKDILHDGKVLNVLLEDQLVIYESKLQKLHEAENEFELFVPAQTQMDVILSGLIAYFTYNNGRGHYFKAIVARNEGQTLTFKLPQVVFQTEKRSYRRKLLPTDLSTIVLLHPYNDNRPLKSFKGTLVDISRDGFLCEVQVPVEIQGMFSSGQTIHYAIDSRWGLDTHGQIRHVQELFRANGSIALQLGIEAGIERSTYQFNRIKRAEWDEITENAGSSMSSQFDSRVVDYTNKKNQRIVALVNATKFHVRAPVVVLPPGFGKKKEALAPFVATLLTNFSVRGKDIITIRYDGINRPGESFNSAKNVKRGYEMLHYRVHQGTEDLKTTLEYVYSNPYFTPEKVILVSFSMSAIDARRYLAVEACKRVDFWISCMGVPSAQSTMQSIFGGIDIIGNYKMGTTNGIMGMLGHVVDMDTLAQDLVMNKYAYMTDTRRDMSKIAIPALWIYGTYDKWVNVREVIDAMSINSNSNREVIEVPSGHNLHTSEDALKAYKIITSRIFRWLNNKSITPLDPYRDEMVRLITYERERLKNETGIETENYWRSYLIGNRVTDSGYDFYNNFDEFQQFMELEALLIGLRPNDRLVDLGCGTGLLLEAILNEAKHHFKRKDRAEVLAVDLIPEALDKTREKCERLFSLYPGLGSVQVKYMAENLEPSRWLPIYEYIHNPELDYNFLRNKIEGLKNADIDKLLEINSKELQQVMKGIIPFPATLKKLESVLGEYSYKAVMDFNKAARFLRKNLARWDHVARCPVASDNRFARTSANLPVTMDIHLNELKLGNQGIKPYYPFKNGSLTKIVASLFLSYLYNPEYAVAEFYRILEPGGTMLVSSMKPDSDVSMMFTSYIETIRDPHRNNSTFEGQGNLHAARAMLNEAAGLFELEQEGFFKFFSAEELIALCENCGFESIQVHRSLGNPPQAIILVAKKPLLIDDASN